MIDLPQDEARLADLPRQFRMRPAGPTCHITSLSSNAARSRRHRICLLAHTEPFEFQSGLLENAEGLRILALRGEDVRLLPEAVRRPGSFSHRSVEVGSNPEGFQGFPEQCAIGSTGVQEGGRRVLDDYAGRGSSPAFAKARPPPGNRVRTPLEPGPAS